MSNYRISRPVPIKTIMIINIYVTIKLIPDFANIVPDLYSIDKIFCSGINIEVFFYLCIRMNKF